MDAATARMHPLITIRNSPERRRTIPKTPKDSHAAHQRLMQKLTICNARIKVIEKEMKNGKGKLPKEQWSFLVSALKTRVEEKKDINNEIRRLP